MDELTPREYRIAGLVAKDFSNESIGQALGISKQTVKNHVSTICSKLRCRSRVGIAVWFVEEDLKKRVTEPLEPKVSNFSTRTVKGRPPGLGDIRLGKMALRGKTHRQSPLKSGKVSGG